MMKKSYDILVNHPINVELEKKDFIRRTPAGSGEPAQNRHCLHLRKRQERAEP